jgi:hypothetical protein
MCEEEEILGMAAPRRGYRRMSLGLPSNLSFVAGIIHFH